MLNNRRFGSDFDKSRKQMRFFGRAFMVVWVAMFVGILGMFGAGIYLQYQCYASQDPSSFACWFASERVEIGVRQR